MISKSNTEGYCVCFFVNLRNPTILVCKHSSQQPLYLCTFFSLLSQIDIWNICNLINLLLSFGFQRTGSQNTFFPVTHFSLLFLLKVKVVTGKDGQAVTPVAIATQLPPNVSAAFSTQQQFQVIQEIFIFKTSYIVFLQQN